MQAPLLIHICFVRYISIRFRWRLECSLPCRKYASPMYNTAPLKGAYLNFHIGRGSYWEYLLQYYSTSYHEFHHVSHSSPSAKASVALSRSLTWCPFGRDYSRCLLQVRVSDIKLSGLPRRLARVKEAAYERQTWLTSELRSHGLERTCKRRCCSPRLPTPKDAALMRHIE